MNRIMLTLAATVPGGCSAGTAMAQTDRITRTGLCGSSFRGRRGAISTC